MLDISTLRANQEMLAILTHNNSLLLNFFSIQNKNSLDGHEILAAIRNNAEKITLFSSFNNSMIEMHLDESLDSGKGEVQEIPLQIPAPEKKKLGRPKGKGQYPIQGSFDIILEFAKAHRGVFEVTKFRREWESMEGAAPSFSQTSIYTYLRKLVKIGVCEKTAAGLYKFFHYKIPDGLVVR